MTTPIPTGSSIPTAFTDDAGNVYANRQLTVTGPDNYSGTVTTDSQGLFRLTGLPIGDYTVSDIVSGTSGVVPVLLSHTAARLATTVVAVAHGTAANTPRPSGATSVIWTGSVKPDFMDPARDIWPGVSNPDPFIAPVAGTFPKRPTASLARRFVWVRTSTTDPLVPIGGEYAIAGHDLIAQP